MPQAPRPAAQGLGLGRTMLEFAERLGDCGYGRIGLFTNEAMVEVLYSRRGYLQTHRAEEKGVRRV
jgi:hypothetical protein